MILNTNKKEYGVFFNELSDKNLLKIYLEFKTLNEIINFWNNNCKCSVYLFDDSYYLGAYEIIEDTEWISEHPICDFPLKYCLTFKVIRKMYGLPSY